MHKLTVVAPLLPFPQSLLSKMGSEVKTAIHDLAPKNMMWRALGGGTGKAGKACSSPDACNGEKRSLMHEGPVRYAGLLLGPTVLILPTSLKAWPMHTHSLHLLADDR